MAEGNSDSSDDIKQIHYTLIRSLVKGNVGHDENTNTHVNWITEFMAVADDPVVRDYSVIKQFQYLESPLKKISPGKYDFLKKVFSKDSNALSKIDKAENDIKRKRESLRSGCKTKDAKNGTKNVKTKDMRKKWQS